jgi:hypothetical protein
VVVVLLAIECIAVLVIVWVVRRVVIGEAGVGGWSFPFRIGLALAGVGQGRWGFRLRVVFAAGRSLLECEDVV